MCSKVHEKKDYCLSNTYRDVYGVLRVYVLCIDNSRICQNSVYHLRGMC